MKLFCLFLIAMCFLSCSSHEKSASVLQVRKEIKLTDDRILNVLDTFINSNQITNQYELFIDRIHPFYSIITFQTIEAQDTIYRNSLFFINYKGHKVNVYSVIEGYFTNNSNANSKIFKSSPVLKRWNLVIKWDSIFVYKKILFPHLIH